MKLYSYIEIRTMETFLLDFYHFVRYLKKFRKFFKPSALHVFPVQFKKIYYEMVPIWAFRAFKID